MQELYRKIAVPICVTDDVIVPWFSNWALWLSGALF